MGIKNWASAIALLVGTCVVFGLLEGLARVWAPPEHEDPRLGPGVFWVWVVLLALATYASMPLFEAGEGPLDLIFEAAGILAWLAWKLGGADHNDGSDRRPREHEQVWASTVGFSLGLAAWFVPQFLR